MTTATAPAPRQAKTAAKLVFCLEGRMPRTGGAIRLETAATPLTRDHLRAAREQLAEALEASLRYRVGQPQLALLTEDGRELRRTSLMESPERDRYLVLEREPGGPAGETDEWMVRCVADFGRKRNL